MFFSPSLPLSENIKTNVLKNAPACAGTRTRPRGVWGSGDHGSHGCSPGKAKRGLGGLPSAGKTAERHHACSGQTGCPRQHRQVHRWACPGSTLASMPKDTGGTVGSPAQKPVCPRGPGLTPAPPTAFLSTHHPDRARKQPRNPLPKGGRTQRPSEEGGRALRPEGTETHQQSPPRGRARAGHREGARAPGRGRAGAARRRASFPGAAVTSPPPRAPRRGPRWQASPEPRATKAQLDSQVPELSAHRRRQCLQDPGPAGARAGCPPLRSIRTACLVFTETARGPPAESPGDGFLLARALAPASAPPAPPPSWARVPFCSVCALDSFPRFTWKPPPRDGALPAPRSQITPLAHGERCTTACQHPPWRGPAL